VKKALFLDRDGTLIIDKVYLSDPAGVEPIPGTRQALKKARDLGYLLFLFTNQSGIGRGLHSIEDTHRVNARMSELLNVSFDGICIAPEAPGQPSRYRKPSPTFIQESLEKFGLDPKACYMVGDSAADLGAALAAGIAAIAVKTGKVDPFTLPDVVLGNVPVFSTFADFMATLS
jgi:D-glycero-D-manno-heptose 1,7-bisphosphate phosphatase